MAGLDPAIHFAAIISLFAKAFSFPWLAAHVLGLDPSIECGHDNGHLTGQRGTSAAS